VVTWTTSKDPEGGKVTYSVNFGDDVLLADSEDLTYTIPNSKMDGKVGNQNSYYYC